MSRFGPSSNQVFTSCTTTPDGGADITMRDGFQFHLTAEESAQAGERINTYSDDPDVHRSANTIYAAEAKRLQMESGGDSIPRPEGIQGMTKTRAWVFV